MKQYISATTFAILLVLFTVQPAKADMETIHSADNAFWLSGGTSLLNYKESISPLPDSEHGWLSSFASGVSLLTNNNLYLALESSATFGNDKYNGAFLFSPTVPITSTTNDVITTIDGRIGKAFPIANKFLLTPYAELGWRYWNRDLGQGDVENYNNFDSLFGLMLQIAPTDRIVLTVYGSGGETFDATMKTGGDTFDLGDAAMYKLGGKVGFNFTQRLEMFTSLDFDHFHYIQSPVLPDGFLEPSSKTSDTAIRVGVAYHFR
jgi:hypothetical protein